MRGGLFAEYNNRITLSSTAKQKGIAAINAMTANSVHYSASGTFHGEQILDVLVMMDSTDQQELFIDEIKNWLNSFNYTQSQNYAMRAAVNSIFTTLYRARWNTAADGLIRSDSSLWSAANNFARRNLHSDADFMKGNLGAEFGRRGDGHETSFIKNTLQSWFDDFDYQTNNEMLWIKAAARIDATDDCSEYGICGWNAGAVAYHLPDVHDCGPTIKIRAQDMSAADMAKACGTMLTTDTLFHPFMNTSGTPVANDLNEQLEVIVFDDYANYQVLANVLYGIATNNGGMYLEGSPNTPGNQARFICHEVWWDRSEFNIWNLEHEYVHYLDGRFDLHGSFSDSYNHEVVWWTEGLAEYVSKLNRNDDAIADANRARWSLSTLFNNSYQESQDRIYKGGYLAVRFMFEKHPEEVQNLLDMWRVGNHAGAQTHKDSLGSTYNTEFRNWSIGEVTSNDDIPLGLDGSGGCSPNCGGGETELTNEQAITISGSDGSETHYFIDVPADQTELKINISGGSGDADLYVTPGSQAGTNTWTCRPYKGGNSEECVIASPAAGKYYVMIKGYHSYSGVSLVATHSGTSGVPVINVGDTINNLSASQGDHIIYRLPLNGSATITITGGTGDADLYTKNGSEPTDSVYDCLPWKTGNEESCSVSYNGDVYIRIKAYNTFSGLTLTVN
jgi:microbial collagenase